MDLFGRLFGKKGQASDEKKSGKEEERGKYMPPPHIPADYEFSMKFKENGGKFLYCADLDEVQKTFGKILDENDWKQKKACCFDQKLKTRFSNYGLEFSSDSEAPFCLLTCEYLVANTGSILLSSNQIGEKKLGDLPHDFVVLAGVSQVIETLGEGLRGINVRKENIPSNITTIKNFSDKPDAHEHFMSYGSPSKNLYLLLLEDL